jgi:hypothetical protein
MPLENSKSPKVQNPTLHVLSTLYSSSAPSRSSWPCVKRKYDLSLVADLCTTYTLQYPRHLIPSHPLASLIVPPAILNAMHVWVEDLVQTEPVTVSSNPRNHCRVFGSMTRDIVTTFQTPLHSAPRYRGPTARSILCLTYL